jgi:hypothetical protein
LVPISLEVQFLEEEEVPVEAESQEEEGEILSH